MKLIQGIPDAFKVKVKSSHFEQQREAERLRSPQVCEEAGRPLELTAEKEDDWNDANAKGLNQSVQESKSLNVTLKQNSLNSVDQILDEELQMRGIENEMEDKAKIEDHEQEIGVAKSEIEMVQESSTPSVEAKALQ